MIGDKRAVLITYRFGIQRWCRKRKHDMETKVKCIRVYQRINHTYVVLKEMRTKQM